MRRQESERGTDDDGNAGDEADEGGGIEFDPGDGEAGGDIAAAVGITMRASTGRRRGFGAA